MQVRFKRISPLAHEPTCGRPGDACFDLYALDGCQAVAHGYIASIDTGIALELPDGYEGVIRGRSGHNMRGMLVPIGTIDSNYRGSLRVFVYNLTGSIQDIAPGERIAQLAIRPIPQIELVEADELSDSARGSAGFGSSGR